MKVYHCALSILLTIVILPLGCIAFVPSWQNEMKNSFYSSKSEDSYSDMELADPITDAFSSEDNSKFNLASSVKTDTYIDIPNYATPAEYENENFELDSSVSFWREYNRDGKMERDDYIEVITDVTNGFVRKGGDALSYWLRHNARTGYFFTNAVLGTVASQLHERFVSQKQSSDGSFGSSYNIDTVVRLLAEVALSYEQDYSDIESGKYKEPYDMYTRNQQNNPLFFGQQTSRFISEAIGTISRRNRGSEQDKLNWLANEDDMRSSANSLYPDYYKIAFHYQTDGWMSQTSANVYETSTETLFLGRQDAMQRTALAPLVKFSREHNDKNSRPMKVLEVACGTGRFMTFARDNLPLDTQCTAVDLSPFYLEKARSNDKLWRSQKTKEEKDLISPLRVVQAKAEELPFLDEEFDVVICMYLYHEIPREVRGQVAAEMARVTKTGGRVILTDSNQKGDRPSLDKVMGNFEKLNEPFFCDYIEDFLPLHFENVGMKCLTKSVRSSTKTLVFEKVSSLKP